MKSKRKKTTSKLPSASVIRNPAGINRFKNNISKAKQLGSPQETIQFHVGSKDIGKRLVSKLRFSSSPSKLSSQHASELLKISKAVALKAIGCLHPNPEKVFDFMCQKEIENVQDGKQLLAVTPEIKSIIWAFKSAKTSTQKKKMLSLLALEYPLTWLRNNTGCNISRQMYWEARFYAKAYGPGGEVPELKFTALTFTEAQLKEVVQFVVGCENTSNLAWGEQFYTTSEGKQYTIPNFQRKSDPEQLWKDLKSCKNRKIARDL